MILRLALAALWLGLAAGGAEARSLRIERFEAEVFVLGSGVIRVRETIRVHFEGSWNGLYRAIPIEYRTPQGFSYRLLVEPTAANDADGGGLRLEPERDRHYLKLKIWVPGASDVTRTIVLEYRVENGLKFFEDHDELYWNLTGDEWDVPIEQASGEIVLPPAATNLRASAFTGAYGSTASDAEVEIADGAVRVRMTRALGYREGLTVAVAWDKGAVAEPSSITRAGWFLRANWPFGVPALVLAGMGFLWWRHGRDPRLRPIVARYEPPEGLTPAEVGTLADDSPDLRDVTATLVDLAVRGFLRIEEKEEAAMLGLWSSKDYVLELRVPRAQWTGLAAHERVLLERVFGSLSALLDHEPALPRIEISDLRNKFYRDLPEVKAKIYDRLLERGYYDHRPDHVRRVFWITGGILAVLSIALADAAAAALSVAPLTVIVSGGLSAAIIAGVGWFMPARTVRGSAALEAVLGLEEFLSRVEADRMERMIRTPETFEKLLPYAMALGVEGRWAKAFEGIYKSPPEWYRGHSPMGFRPQSFVSSLGRMSTAAGAAMASAPRSSGGSGFGGGGRSGGGFGGGGGGGF
jgi:hypothetical protein